MSTQMVQAFQKAGVKMTKAERIWRYLKDKPRRTVKQLEQDLHMKSISSPIHYMHAGGLLRVEQDRYNGRIINLYYAKGEEFYSEGLYAKSNKPKAAKTPVAPEPVMQVVSGPVPVSNQTLNLDNLTIAEARNLYLQLKKMFAV